MAHGLACEMAAVYGGLSGSATHACRLKARHSARSELPITHCSDARQKKNGTLSAEFKRSGGRVPLYWDCDRRSDGTAIDWT
ncbi:hypothetical protein HYPGJ_20438 [Hyphomicrobium sp. GJ21]|nr:hypothetical protein HYPGJ_20438 [Hyphomicrobium sp. GJ21]